MEEYIILSRKQLSMYVREDLYQGIIFLAYKTVIEKFRPDQSNDNLCKSWPLVLEYAALTCGCKVFIILNFIIFANPN